MSTLGQPLLLGEEHGASKLQYYSSTIPTRRSPWRVHSKTSHKKRRQKTLPPPVHLPLGVPDRCVHSQAIHSLPWWRTFQAIMGMSSTTNTFSPRHQTGSFLVRKWSDKSSDLTPVTSNPPLQFTPGPHPTHSLKLGLPTTAHVHVHKSTICYTCMYTIIPFLLVKFFVSKYNEQTFP